MNELFLTQFFQNVVLNKKGSVRCEIAKIILQKRDKLNYIKEVLISGKFRYRDFEFMKYTEDADKFVEDHFQELEQIHNESFQKKGLPVPHSISIFKSHAILHNTIIEIAKEFVKEIESLQNN